MVTWLPILVLYTAWRRVLLAGLSGPAGEQFVREMLWSLAGMAAAALVVLATLLVLVLRLWRWLRSEQVTRAPAP